MDSKGTRGEWGALNATLNLEALGRWSELLAVDERIAMLSFEVASAVHRLRAWSRNLASRGSHEIVVGEVVAGDGTLELTGSIPHAGWGMGVVIFPIRVDGRDKDVLQDYAAEW